VTTVPTRAGDDSIAAILEASPFAVILLTEDLSVRHANSAAFDFVGYRQTALFAEDFLALFADHERPAIAAALHEDPPGTWSSIQVLHRGEEWAVEYIARRIVFEGESFIAVTLTDRNERRGLRQQVATAETVARRQDLLVREKEEQYRRIFEATTDGIFIVDLDGRIIAVNAAACRMYGYDRDELVAMNVGELTFPVYRASTRENLRRIREGQAFVNRSVDVRKDGSTFNVEVRGTVFTYGGKPRVLGVTRDITEQERARELLEERVSERTRELSTLLEVSRDVASTLELQPLLGVILDQLKTVAEYTGAALFQIQGGELVVLVRRAPGPDPSAGPNSYPVQGNAVWDVLQRGQPIILDDVRGDTELARGYRASVGGYLETAFAYERSWLAAPMVLKDRIVGAITLSSQEPGFFTLHHAELAMALARQAAIAIENAQLYEQAQRLAVLAERQRLARELHDSVSQALYGISLGARTARAQLDRDPELAAEPLDYVLSQAEAGLTEMRALIFELRPETLESEGLVGALRRQMAAARVRHGVEVIDELTVEPSLPLPVKEATYRIAQEAMHNAVRHAAARHVWVQLAMESSKVTLTIRDDGTGFDPEASVPGHLGLQSMRERAASVGADLEITSAPGSGSTVRVTVPLAA
jgi:PAS domain S-box-containing protein